MLSQFKQAGKTTFAHNEAVLEVDVKAPVEEERSVSVARLTVGMDRTLVGRLLKRFRCSAKHHRLAVKPTLLDQPWKPALIATLREKNVRVHRIVRCLNGGQHG